MKKKAAVNGGASERHLCDMQTELFKAHLPLLEHCAIRQYDDGDSREVGWLQIGTNGSAWYVRVKDPDSGMSFTAIGATVDQALDTAALHLGCDEAPWEIDPYLRSKKPRKGK